MKRIAGFFMMPILAVMVLTSSCQTKTNSSVNRSNKYAALFQLRYEADNKVIVQTKDINNQVLSSIVKKDEKAFKRVVLLNTPYCAYVSALKAQENVVGVAALEKLNAAALGFNLDSVKNVGQNGVLNLEKIQALQPDLIICNSYQINELSLITTCPILIVNEFWEQHPLAKVEWLKLFGVLFNRIENGYDLFQEEEKAYLSHVQKQKSKLKVMNMQAYGAHYYAPGCVSLLNRLLNDAGVVVPCSGADSKSTELSKEQVIMHSLQLDVLLYFSNTEQTKMEVLTGLDIPDFKGKLLFCNTVKSGYFEEAVLQPHQLLKELNKGIYSDVKKGKYFKELK